MKVSVLGFILFIMGTVSLVPLVDDLESSYPWRSHLAISTIVILVGFLIMLVGFTDEIVVEVE